MTEEKDPVKLKIGFVEGMRGIVVQNISDQTLECDLSHITGDKTLSLVPAGKALTIQTKWKIEGIPIPEDVKGQPPEIIEEFERIDQRKGPVIVLMAAWAAKDGGTMIYNHSIKDLAVVLEGHPIQPIVKGAIVKFPKLQPSEES